MGNKAGYAAAILAALGLRSGLGADAYAWAEADDDVRALLRCYPDAAMLRRVADIIRGWADEEPRALWERLRAERKAQGPRMDAESVAAWFPLASWAFRNGNIQSGFNAGVESGEPWNASAPVMVERCHRLAEFAVVASSNRLINVADDGTGDLRNTGAGGTTFGGEEFATPAGEVAARFQGLAEEVAGWVQLGVWSYRQGDLNSGGPVLPGDRRQDTSATATARVARRAWPPVAIFARIPAAGDVADLLGTPGDLEGAVVYMDPPYVGTTGYRHELGRDQVVTIARDYAALGAVVCISEAEPIEALGWEATEISAARRGQKRTFSKQQAEWLTMSRPPHARVARQVPLLSGDACR